MGEGRTLENNLVDDTAARSPELDTVLLGGRLEEVEHLLVAHDGALRGVDRRQPAQSTYERVYTP